MSGVKDWCFHSQGPGDDGGAGHLTLVLDALLDALDDRDVKKLEKRVPGLTEYLAYAERVTNEKQRLDAQRVYAKLRRDVAADAVAKWERENPPPR